MKLLNSSRTNPVYDHLVAGEQLVVVQLNVYRMRWRWHERARLILDELARLQPDVICLQEVAPFRRQAQWLARQLTARIDGPYRAYVTRKRGWRGLLEGIAILTRLPASDFASLPLGRDRVAQRLRVRVGARPVTFANTHFSAGGAEPIRQARIEQASRLLAWLGDPGPLVVAGDLNAQPVSRTLARFTERGLRSAYLLANGREPDRTVPSFEAPRPAYVLDYILVNEQIEVLTAEVAFTRPSPTGLSLYPSDHFGLVAHLAIRG